MSEGSYSLFITVYQLAAALLLVIGFWKILVKCGMKGWYALIPGYNYYKIGICAGRHREGFICMILELLGIALRASSSFLQEKSEYYLYVVAAILALALINLIYKWRIFSGVCRLFERSRKWMFLWVPLSWLAALIFGFRKDFVPVNLGDNADDELLAGTDPANIKFISNITETQKEGLVVLLKDRVVSDLSKRRYLLKDIYFAIPNQSMVLMLGGSGSGKTTLVNAILGYEKANAEIYLNGKNVYKNYEQMKYRIGFVPQADLLRPHDTVYNTLMDAARLRLPSSMSTAEMKQRVEEVMHVLGLTAGSKGLVSKKSGGFRKRISIGTELVADPELFVLDEPDSGLDGVIARELFEKLHEIAHQKGIVLTITHTPDRVADLFDMVIVLARDSGRVGRLAFCGTPDEAKEFFGKNSMEEIVMAISKKDEGGEGRADEFIAKYSDYMHDRLESDGKEQGNE